MLYRDLSKLSEDDRIDLIGNEVRSKGRPTAFAVEADDNYVKGNRYIAKLRVAFPEVRVLRRSRGVLPGIELIRVGIVDLPEEVDCNASIH